MRFLEHSYRWGSCQPHTAEESLQSPAFLWSRHIVCRILVPQTGDRGYAPVLEAESPNPLDRQASVPEPNFIKHQSPRHLTEAKVGPLLALLAFFFLMDGLSYIRSQ